MLRYGEQAILTAASLDLKTERGKKLAQAVTERFISASVDLKLNELLSLVG